jgi:hypothetical protein
MALLMRSVLSLESLDRGQNEHENDLTVDGF